MLAGLLLAAALQDAGPTVPPPPAEADWQALVRWGGEALQAVGYDVDLEGIEVEVVPLGTEEEREAFAARARSWLASGASPGLFEALDVIQPLWSSGLRKAEEAARERGEPVQGSLDSLLATWLLERVATTRQPESRIVWHALPAEALAPFARIGALERWHVAVHEVAHVGQFPVGLSRVLATTEERSISQALVEGEAELAMLAVHAALTGPPLDRRSAHWVREESWRLAFRPPPNAYATGAAFLHPVFVRGGWSAVRALHAEPPTSSEQILHPEKLGRDLPTPVRLPEWPKDRGTPSFRYEEVLGEAGIARALTPPWVSPESMRRKLWAEAARAHVGWDGDRLAVARFPDGTEAAMWRTVWDRDLDAQQFLDRCSEEFLGRWGRSDRVVDWTWSSDLELERALLDALGDVPQELPGAGDAASTAAIERG